MSIAEKQLTIAGNVERVYDAGKKAEYDAFWDGFQLSGTRTNYGSAFIKSPFTKEVFSPKYDMICSTCDLMFAYIGSDNALTNSIKNVKKHLADLGVRLDTSGCPNLKQTFYSARIITNLPPINAEGCTDLTATFYNCYNLVEIEELILKDDGSNSFSDNSQYERTFSGCTALKEIRIRGMIGNSISFKDSTKLSRASIDSILSALAGLDTGITGKTLTLSEAAVNAAYPGGDLDDDFGLVTSVIPNWTFVLV